MLETTIRDFGLRFSSSGGAIAAIWCLLRGDGKGARVQVSIVGVVRSWAPKVLMCQAIIHFTI